MPGRLSSFITRRLILRPWRATDRSPFRLLNDDPEATRYFPNRLTPERSDQLMDRWQEHIDRRGWGFWAVERVLDGAFIGAVGIGNILLDVPFAPAVEIGWRLLPCYWRKGYASEAAREALRIGFDEVRLDEIVAFTLPVNMASRGVMERLGMRRDPAGDFDHPSLEVDHPMCRHVLYRLKRGDWRRSA